MSLNYEVKSIFPQPLLVVDVENHQEFKSILEPLYRKTKEIYPLRKETDNNLFFYKRFKPIKDAMLEYTLLYYKVILGVDRFTSDDIIICNSWMNVMTTNCGVPKHSHKNSHVSGVYYISFDEHNHPPIVFSKVINNNTNILQSTLSLHPDKETEYTKVEYSFTPKEGQLCLFQSDLVHHHENNSTTTKRVSLPFNTVAKKYSVMSDKDSYFDYKKYEINIEDKNRYE